MSDESFRRAVERAAPVVRQPRLQQDLAQALAELGGAVLKVEEAAAIVGSAGAQPMPVAAIAAGWVANKALQLVDDDLRPLAEQLGLTGTSQIPPAAIPEHWQRVLLALGLLQPAAPADPQPGDVVQPPADEPIEVRAARSGLVIAS